MASGSVVAAVLSIIVVSLAAEAVLGGMGSLVVPSIVVPVSVLGGMAVVLGGMAVVLGGMAVVLGGMGVVLGGMGVVLGGIGSSVVGVVALVVEGLGSVEVVVDGEPVTVVAIFSPVTEKIT